MAILVFLGLSLIDLRPMYTTDRRQIASSFNTPPGGHKKGMTKGKVCSVNSYNLHEVGELQFSSIECG